MPTRASSRGARALSLAPQRRHARRLTTKLAAVDKVYADAKWLFTAQEARTVVLLAHVQSCATRYDAVVNDVELGLEKQVINALGKVILPGARSTGVVSLCLTVGRAVDFDKYMQFHAQHKLLAADFAPVAFNYAVRRPLHCPEGVLSFEVRDSLADRAID